MISTPICDMLGIRYPIFQGGMAWISDGKLAGAVSEAGGLGIISAMNANAEYLREQIKIARELTERGVPTKTGKEKWKSTKIGYMLTNEKYIGDSKYQKCN